MLQNVSQWQNKNTFGNSQDILFVNKMELWSLLPMVSLWPVRCSERRDPLEDKTQETTGWVTCHLMLEGSVFWSQKVKCSEARSPRAISSCSCGRTLRGFWSHMARLCWNLDAKESASITGHYELCEQHTLSGLLSEHPVLLALWGDFFIIIYLFTYFCSYTLEKHFSSQKLNFPVKAFCWKIHSHPDFHCLSQTCSFIQGWDWGFSGANRV